MDNWREKWEKEREMLERFGSSTLLRQRDLPEGRTRIRLLTYEPPIPVWTHWIKQVPYHCNGSQEILLSGKLDPENCEVCRFCVEEGIPLVEAKPRQTWMVPCSLREDEPKFVILEISKQLYTNLIRIALNKRNDILAADIIIEKKVRSARGFTEYTADIVEDSPMLDIEKEWSEIAYEQALAIVPSLDEERLAGLVNGSMENGEPFSDSSESSTTAEEQPKPTPTIKTIKKRSIGL